jgi:glutamyl-tRNA reductase
LPLSVYGFEFSLDTAPLDALEAVTRTLTRPEIAQRFSRADGTEEVALLSTCHRVELVLLVRSPDALDRWREALPGEPASWVLREGRGMVHHLFRVAAGRESLAVGEAEVAHQVRAAARSVESRHPRPVLRELFDAAAEAAIEVAPPDDSAPSIAAAAAARLTDLVGRAIPRVLVVGSGTVGRQVLSALAPSARLTVVFHQRPPEESFLTATGARAVPLDRLAEEIASTDAVVTAAKFGNHGLRAADLPRDRPIVLVDLGMPRNIDPDVRELENVRLVDLEELHARPTPASAGRGPEARIATLAGQFSDRLEPLLLEPWVDTFRRAAEEVRRSELENARAFLRGLDPEQEAALERLTQRLVARVLVTPTERIRSLPPGPEGDRLRRWAVDLLRPRPGGP